MADWTVDQVSEWLATNGFEKYIKTFKDEDIDGVALIGLQDDDITKLLAVLDEDGTRRNPKMRIQRKFRAKLEEYKALIKQERKKKRRTTNASVIEESAIARNTVPTTDDVEQYSKTYIVEPLSTSSKFFKSEVICSNLTKYFLTNYNVKCHIPIQDQYDTKAELHIRLSGVKEHVKNARNDLQALFEKIKTKIFNDENADKRVIGWSKHIYSDSALTILQKIFSDKKKLTVWEKTNILSGYYIVHYLSGNHKFSVSEEFINHTINTEISYVRDIVIQNVENIQKQFRKDLDEFISDKKEQQQQVQTMAIIYCQYPEMKICFFGLKYMVGIAKNQVKCLVNKHRMRTIRIELDSTQRCFILDNYVHELRNIEFEYKDDNVKIQVRENLIIAPQYLIMKIKHLIQAMIFQTTTLIFQCIENAFIITERDHLQLNALAQNYNCEIDRIDIQTKKEPMILPKGKNASASKFIIEESDRFYSSLTILKKASILNHTIEIHRSNDLKVDIHVLSTTADAIREKIDPKYGNGYFESDTGKKVLFIQWVLSHSQENNDRMKESIKKFISTSLDQIEMLCKHTVNTVSFATTEWENGVDRKQLSRGIIKEMKNQLQSKQFSSRSWRIIFVFDDGQVDLFNEFSQVIAILQTENDDYEQFFCPTSTTSIILKTSGNSNISRCENVIKNYMKNSIHTTIKLDNPFDSEIWNQYMTNAYYKYCLEKFVLPKIHQIDKQNQHLDLIGPISAVNEAKEKYELMSAIQRQRILVHAETKNVPDSYNIILSCCSDDKVLSRRLTDRLTDEGYLVSMDFSDKSSSTLGSKINKTDLIIICFSFNYSQNVNCLKAMISVQSSGKKIVPIILPKSLSHHEDGWLQMIQTEELYYEAFKDQIKFKMKEDLGVEYDRLLIELLHYTKPGVVGRTYSVSETVSNNDRQAEEKFDPQDTLSKISPEQVREKEQIYEEKIEKILKRDKIPDDDLTDLIESLKLVIEDVENEEYSRPEEEQELEESSQEEEEEEQDNQQSENEGSQQNDASLSENAEDHQNEHEEEEADHVSNYLTAFLSSIQRWMEKASNGPVIKGNLPPFTLTGDFDDAQFPTPLTNKAPWWAASANLYGFDDWSSDLDSRKPSSTIGSWCSYDEAHHYFQKLIDIDIQFREKKQEQKQKQEQEQKRKEKQEQEQKQEQRLKDEKSKDNKTDKKAENDNPRSYFKTNIKKGTVAWDIDQNREVLEEYERRQSGGKPKQITGYSAGWTRLMDTSVQIISDIKEGKIDMKSDVVQGKIGNELKETEKIRKRNELDDPNNKIWTKTRYFKWRREFIQMKINNTIEWEKFCGYKRIKK